MSSLPYTQVANVPLAGRRWRSQRSSGGSHRWSTSGPTVVTLLSRRCLAVRGVYASGVPLGDMPSSLQTGDLRVGLPFELKVCMFIYLVENAHLVIVYAFRKLPMMFYVQNPCQKPMFMACTDEYFVIRKGKD